MKNILIMALLALAGCTLSSDGHHRPRPVPVMIERTAESPAPPPRPAPTASITPIHPIKPKIDLPLKPQIKIQNDIEKQLSVASIALSVPEAVNLRDEINVQLLVNQAITPSSLSKQLKNQERKIEAKIKVSKILIAKITAPDFHIEPVTPEEQILSDTETTDWNWRLKAKGAGEYTLNVTVVAVINVDDQKVAERHIKTFDHQITITVKTGQVIEEWISKYWQWLISTLILPLSLWIWKQWKDRKDH